MFSRVRRWVSERWPLEALIRLSLEEEMPGGASFAYIFGSSLVLIFSIQAITGICQLFYYVPATDRAYDSLNYLRTEVPFGWLIHGLHYWGATTMIVLLGLHMCRVFIWGAYKHPRQLTWLIGVGLLLVTQGLMFTGPTLSWNEQGYWAAEVGTSIAGTVPWVGDLAKRLLRGGAEMGQLTLSRFFILHVAILPGVLLTLIAIHVTAFRQFGISGPWDEKKRQLTGFFWPDQIFKDALVFAFVFLLLIGLTVFFRPPFEGPADPLDTTYIPKPEWNFLFLYQALKLFPGKLEPIGTVGVPLFLFFLLVFLPFLDRCPDRSPRKRLRFMVGGLIYVSTVLSLAAVGYFSKAGTVQPTALTVTAPAIGSTRAPQSASARQGEQLFRSLPCLGCHRVNGQGGVLGPELSSETLRGKGREWLVTQIRDPKAHNSNTIMPAFSTLKDAQLNAMVDYLLSLAPGGAPGKAPAAVGLPSGPPATQEGAKSRVPAPAVPAPPGPESPALIGPQGPPGKAAYIVGAADRGAILFRQTCEACHGSEGTDKVPNPGSDGGLVPPLNPINRALYSSNPQTFAESIDRYIQHGSMPKGVTPLLHMLPFGDTNTLTQPVISNIEAYILELNGVDRAQSISPGIAPKSFFWLVVIVYGGVALGLAWAWNQRSKRIKKG